jgi:drug/metabolite transporter (DMT)-like permease
MISSKFQGQALAILSAVLFGVSTPLAKVILGDGVSPWLLAGLLYAGSGLGLGAIHLSRRTFGLPSPEAPLRRADLPWLAAVILFGGLAGPLFLMAGLARTEASTASLLLNLEGLATMAIAWVVFKENVDRRLFLGAMLILAGAVLLSWLRGPGGVGVGAVLIAAACISWGIDNNLTRKLSSADPVQIAMIKGLVAGTVNLMLTLLLGGSELPSFGVVAASGVLGFLGYGVSLVLFVLALRYLGSARTGAYFSTAPFVGALTAVLLFAEPISLRLLVAGGLMAVGLYLHLVEVHDHEHVHEPMEHEHLHVHDEHHQHSHSPEDPAGEPHSHWHRHERLRHKHRHFPDLHHRHDHAHSEDNTS